MVRHAAVQHQVQELLAEAITVLCKNSLSYRSEFCVEGLLGITLDSEEIFLVNIKEIVQKAAGTTQETSSPRHSPSQRDTQAVGSVIGDGEESEQFSADTYRTNDSQGQMYSSERRKRHRRRRSPSTRHKSPTDDNPPDRKISRLDNESQESSGPGFKEEIAFQEVGFDDSGPGQEEQEASGDTFQGYEESSSHQPPDQAEESDQDTKDEVMIIKEENMADYDEYSQSDNRTTGAHMGQPSTSAFQPDLPFTSTSDQSFFGAMGDQSTPPHLQQAPYSQSDSALHPMSQSGLPGTSSAEQSGMFVQVGGNHCPTCQLTFSTPGSLKRHFNTARVHRSTVITGLGNIACPTCGKRFTRPDSLKRHIKVFCQKQ